MQSTKNIEDRAFRKNFQRLLAGIGILSIWGFEYASAVSNSYL